MKNQLLLEPINAFLCAQKKNKATCRVDTDRDQSFPFVFIPKSQNRIKLISIFNPTERNRDTLRSYDHPSVSYIL